MFHDTRLGNCPRWFLNRPQDWNMRVPQTVRDCVVFVGLPTTEGGLNLRGTAFLVGVPLGSTTHAVGYLVAAKHTADKIEGKTFGIRFNLCAGGADTVWVDETAKWWRHPSEPDAVDAAILPFRLPDVAECSVIGTNMFLTDEIIGEVDFGPGDEVFLTGLFIPMKSARNEPIVRMGSLAVMPRSLIPGVKISGKAVEAEVYLIEARSLGGISGSPVFIRETLSVRATRTTGKRKGQKLPLFGSGPFYLLGLMHGHWTIQPQEHDRYDFETSTRIDESIALGIAVVVPAKKILEIINQPGLVMIREARESALHELRHTTPTD